MTLTGKNHKLKPSHRLVMQLLLACVFSTQALAKGPAHHKPALAAQDVPKGSAASKAKVPSAADLTEDDFLFPPEDLKADALSKPINLNKADRPKGRLPVVSEDLEIRPKVKPYTAPKGAAPIADVSDVIPQSCVIPTGKFNFSWDKAKIVDIVEQISQLTCKNFILSSGIKGINDISIISRTKVNIDQAWQAFMAALEGNDMALVKVGEYNKIIKRTDATKSPVPVVDNRRDLPNTDGIITYLYEMRNASRDNVRALIKNLLTRTGDIDASGDILVITDAASNIRRIMQILDKIDVPGATERIRIVSLNYRDPQETVQKLNEVFDSKIKNKAGFSGGKGGGLPGLGFDLSDEFSINKIFADEAGRRIFVISSDRAFERIKDFIRLYDTQAADTAEQGQVHIYKIKYGDATKIAATLSSLTQASRNRGYLPPVGGSGSDSAADLFDGNVKITADEASRSLVIVANRRAYSAVLKILEKLDQRRVQVYIEAVIMDLAINDSNNLSVNAFGLVPGPGGTNFLLANPGGDSMLTNISKALTQGGAAAAVGALAPFLSTLGFQGPMANIPIPGGGGTVPVPSVGAVIQALQSDNTVDVLSTPATMVQDNEKAELAVGERYPVAKGISTVGIGTGAGGAGFPLQSFTYEDVKLKFIVTPHVNDDNKIRMEIDQDQSEIGQNISFPGGNNQPVIRTKSVKTTVVTADQQTIVMGGLINHVTRDTVSKIPILGDIPVIGTLFKTTIKEVVKRNLLLVLTPYIIRTEDDYVKIYERKLKEREDFQKMYFGDKIKRYDPSIDYNKKVGPLTQIVNHVDAEMVKIENGGPGLPGEEVIKPQVQTELELPTEEDVAGQERVKEEGISAPESLVLPPEPEVVTGPVMPGEPQMPPVSEPGQEAMPAVPPLSLRDLEDMDSLGMLDFAE